jgi:MoxR-like ATPase
MSVNPLSPRAGKSLLAAAKAWAFIDERDHVLPDDIQTVFSAVCEHRLNAHADLHDNTRDISQGKYSNQLLAKVDPALPFE